MILNQLVEYYDRKDALGEIPKPGLEPRRIDFLVVVDKNGKFTSLEDMRKPDGNKKLAGMPYHVPRRVGRTSGIKANLLYDNSEYALGVVANGATDKKITPKHDAFLARIRGELKESQTKSPCLRAVVAFLENPQSARDVVACQQWRNTDPEELNKAWFSFRLDGEDSPVFAAPSVCDEIIANAMRDKKRWVDKGKKAGERCIVSGGYDSIARVHDSIQGFNSTGISIVSYNQEAFNSYGKKQSRNAFVGETAAQKYVAALNMLLSKDSDQKIAVAGGKVIFWARKDVQLVNDIAAFFGEAQKDNPDDRRAQAVKHLYESVKRGDNAEIDATPFYILGLSPNRARLAVSFWYEGTAGETAKNICAHFKDVEIAGMKTPPGMLALTATLGRADNIAPSLGGDMLRAALTGAPYPRTALIMAVIRCRAEAPKKEAKNDNRAPRAALIKACINRFYRKNRLSPVLQLNKEITMALDPENKSPGYCLGRLFAALEKLQEDANRGIKATIRAQFYGAASASPGVVFPILMRKHHAHLTKLESTNQKIAIATVHKRRIGEIKGLLNNFPPRLTLEEQGLFALGYYHQRDYFFTPKKEKDNEQK